MLDYGVVANKTEIHSEYLGESLLNLLDRTFEVPGGGFSYSVFKVTEKYVARPDLIAYDAYGDPSKADIICKLNGISNPFELNKDAVLILPRPEDIGRFYVTPSQEDMDTASSSYTQTPSPKAKTSTKRKANEAVTGDKRFRINQSNGIIIY